MVEFSKIEIKELFGRMVDPINYLIDRKKLFTFKQLKSKINKEIKILSIKEMTSTLKKFDRFNLKGEYLNSRAFKQIEKDSFSNFDEKVYKDLYLYYKSCLINKKVELIKTLGKINNFLEESV